MMYLVAGWFKHLYDEGPQHNAPALDALALLWRDHMTQRFICEGPFPWNSEGRPGPVMELNRYVNAWAMYLKYEEETDGKKVCSSK